MWYGALLDYPDQAVLDLGDYDHDGEGSWNVVRVDVQTGKRRRLGNVRDKLYSHLIYQHTTTRMTPEEVHQIGVQEVARIELDEVLQRLDRGEVPLPW